MRWLTRLGRTLFGATDDGARDELRQHVEMETADLMARGVAPDEARRQALLALGGVDRFREEARDTRGLRWLDDLRRDVGYSFRSLGRSPGFTVVVVLTLALGIGANATFFSILNALVLKPLSVHEPERLVMLAGNTTNPVWEEIRDRQSQIFDAAFAWSPEAFDLSAGGPTDTVDGAYVSGDLLRALGVAAERGRILTTDDDRRGGGSDGPVAVISHRLWQDRFSGATDVIGRSLNVERIPFTIVGVMPQSFFGLDVGRTLDVMVPLGTEPLIRGANSFLDRRGTWWLNIGGRLAPGQTIDQAQAALRTVQPQIRDATVPANFSAQRAEQYLSAPMTLTSAATGHSRLRARYQPALVAIMVVVGLVLLIACANVANLVLARATTRQREMNLRLALGATRARLTTQMLVESTMLATMGTAVGLVAAMASSALVVRQLSTWRETVLLNLSLDWRVFAFLAVVTGLTALVFGLAPAWRVRASSPQHALRESGRGVAGDRGLGVRNVLAVSQIAVSLVLLVAAGLFLRTFVTLNRTPIGMTTESLAVIDINLQASGVPPEARAQLVERLRQAAVGVPGVTAAASAVVTPLSGGAWGASVDAELSSSGERASGVNGVSPGWFDTVGAVLKEGRDFSSADGPAVVIVNETFAQRFLAPGPVVGRTIRASISGSNENVFEVIGVSSDVMYQSPREGMVPTMFVPFGLDDVETSMFVRTANGRYAEAMRAVADELQRIDPRAAFTFRTFDDLVSATVTQERLTAGLSVAFGALALGLAAIGLYGVMSYSVTRRRAELAVRMALGADRATISRLVLGRGTALVLVGIVIGGVASWWASQYVQTLLFQLDARDLMTMAGAAIVLAVVGLAAAWIPAWRASRIDPAGLLREG